MCVRESLAGNRDRRAHRVPLLRHGRGDPAGRLGHLADLGLGEQDDVAADLCGRSRRCRQRRSELGEALAVRVPGEGRLHEAELLREESDDLERPVPERCERPGRTAELGCEPLVVHGRESPARLERRGQPARRLQPERRRHRLLQERARGHRRRAMGARQLRASCGEPVELREHELRGAARDEHRGRVHDVLARRAQVDLVGGVRPHLGAKRPDERLRRVPDCAALLGEALGVVEIGPARLRDARGGLRR